MKQTRLRYGKPDFEEKAIRFGCGAVVGLLLAFLYSISLLAGGWTTAASMLISAIGLGYLATHYGDRFWHKLLQWLVRCFAWF